MKLPSRAQSLYCAISLAERRNKAIAPYEPTRDIRAFTPVFFAGYARQ
jgi:hypothetical protein